MAKLLSPSAAQQPKKRAPEDANTDQAVWLNHSELIESSGLAASNRLPGVFWSHNDSGGEPRLFAFDRSGKNTGICRLGGAEAIDWEDMASFVLNGKARLIVADCGDNDANRNSISLYLLAEPDPHETTQISSFQPLVLSYPDGARNCEAIAVDTVREKIILIAKSTFATAGVYTIPLSTALQKQGRSLSVTAKRAGGLSVPMISAMDLDPTSGSIWVINYFQAFQYPCEDRTQPLEQQLSKLPKAIELPRWRQIEAVAVDSDHQVWVTSEGSPAPLGRLRLSNQ